MTSTLTSPHTADPDAPVVIRFPALGDAVLLTVLLDALARRYGRPVHLLASGAWTGELLAHDPAAAELRLVTSRRAPYLLTPSRWSANRWLAAHRGPVYLCERDVYAQRIVERARIAPERLVRAWDHWPGDEIHWADWWRDIAALDAPGMPGPLAIEPVSAQPRLHVPPAWHVRAREWLHAAGLEGRPLVLLQPGHKKTHKRGRVATAGHDKHWPAERWAAVAQGIAAGLPRAAVLVCGSPREAPLAGETVAAAGTLPGGAVVVNAAARDLALPVLAGLATLAHGMVSVDTGPAHVAAALDCPLVVLFGQHGHGRWKPRAPHADVIALGNREPTDGARVMDIGVDTVLQAWHTLRLRETQGIARAN